MGFAIFFESPLLHFQKHFMVLVPQLKTAWPKMARRVRGNKGSRLLRTQLTQGRRRKYSASSYLRIAVVAYLFYSFLLPFFKYSVPLRLISAQIFYPVVLDCEGIVVIGEALVDLFMHDSQLLQSQHWHIFFQNRIIFLIDFCSKIGDWRMKPEK